MTVVTPKLKLVPLAWLIPVNAEIPVVAPVFSHVKVVTAQLSAKQHQFHSQFPNKQRLYFLLCLQDM